ncbi:hypothetical protein Tco_0928729 [Tanacetum coccineum]
MTLKSPTGDVHRDSFREDLGDPQSFPPLKGSASRRRVVGSGFTYSMVTLDGAKEATVAGSVSFNDLIGTLFILVFIIRLHDLDCDE